MRNGYGNCEHSQQWLCHAQVRMMTLGFADFGAGLG
jgi:hypothetical protein